MSKEDLKKLREAHIEYGDALMQCIVAEFNGTNPKPFMLTICEEDSESLQTYFGFITHQHFNGLKIMAPLNNGDCFSYMGIILTLNINPELPRGEFVLL